ncbi:MAG TPA: bifunctional 2-C-methyl-D-erythritol 4-phosphate cytidylyltransferase/2-C-methyl-D-erythritol 2,4-cyclodiphosphate synthase, partial [Rhodospirillaceae bacterium]|nr:bifunctional 2-C-methyl-D-erythritol 4-phosphate cytidylyltransferase/2-C-methyl-D-erythritol 2,4-cyclodiphosphate synthase [Rhodospirillaceae bacterium]
MTVPATAAKPKTAALLVAAGRGIRFMADRPKQYLDLQGMTVLRRSVLAFLNHPTIDLVQVVIGDDHHDLYQQAVGDLPLLPPVIGGETRQQSVANGLTALADHEPEQVLIHDAARPLIGAETLDAVMEALTDSIGAIVAVPVADTLKHADDSSRIERTVSREDLWQAQTPQAFRF